ncbi:hypothetical protein [Xenorhabdus kozodoii]|uniref:Uncharacterized protein n=1 Tax=Xenorhabdus kozodoii TaxID=351676 RepID=A0A2D0LI28_9GAMM|nr:hypothetical protein [Xenorhabdus kozodoii]PHM75250.1 hypothetical protein Xkoz_00266 [Xenorhabdus kozodoii]
MNESTSVTESHFISDTLKNDLENIVKNFCSVLKGIIKLLGDFDAISDPLVKGIMGAIDWFYGVFLNLIEDNNDELGI